MRRPNARPFPSTCVRQVQISRHSNLLVLLGRWSVTRLQDCLRKSRHIIGSICRSCDHKASSAAIGNDMAFRQRSKHRIIKVLVVFREKVISVLRVPDYYRYGSGFVVGVYTVNPHA